MNGNMCDIIDAPIFQDKTQWLLDEQYDLNLMLSLSIDWYQQYSTTAPYSVGVIYMTLVNLPRQLRQQKKNVFVIGKNFITMI